MAFHVLCHQSVLARSVMSNSLWPHGLYPTRLLCPCNFPGKSTGVGYHSLLQGSSWPRDRTQVSLLLAHWSNKRCPLDGDWFCRLPLRVTLTKSTYNEWPMLRKRGRERFLRIMTEPQDHKDTSRRHDIPQVRCHLPSYKSLILTSC